MLSSFVRMTSIVGVAVAATAFVIGPISAQTGTVSGQVTAQATGQPLANVQVSIADLNIGSLSQGNGRYLLLSVPVGIYDLQVTSIGYGMQTVQVTVAADQVAQADFQMATVALNLDEIVVTGTGAPTQRRRLGQTIAVVSGDELRAAPITSVADALIGRVPGARGLVSGGQTGNGSMILLRGSASVSQRQSPIIYVDGIRIDNSRESVRSVQTDRLMDINPQDIERVEIIKGAAAATLYGTEASSGVIQIFTKRGQSGAPVYNFSTDLQSIGFPRRFEDNCGYDAAAHNVVCNYPYDHFVKFGYHQNYNLSVAGGTSAIRYYVSGRIMEEVNPSPNNNLNNRSIRASFDFVNSDKLTSSIDVSVVSRVLQAAETSWGDVFGDLMLANPLVSTEDNPFGAYTDTKITEVTENYQRSNNFIANGMIAYQWTDNIKSTLRAGYNFIDSEFSEFFPQGVVKRSQRGARRVTDRRFTTTTLDFNTFWESQISDRLMGNLTVGAQSFREERTNNQARVRDFASPTLSTLSGGSTYSSISEGFVEVINAGIFAQGQVGLDDRLFFTAGVRFDGNSSFGSEFDLVAYPKAGVSLVISEYDFWNVDFVDELRLRGAYGTSGLQPSAFAAQRTWSPSSNVIGGYVEPQNLGNAALKPEKSTEIELAVEAGMFNGRLGIEVVYFNQATNDALLPVRPSPGTGFTRNQLQNLGQLKSQGLEIKTQTRLVQTPNFTWDLTVSPSFLKQWVSDMGGLADFRLASRRRWSSLYQGMWPGIWIGPVADPNQPYILKDPDVNNLRKKSDIASNTLKNAAGGDSMAVHGRPNPNQTIDFGSVIQWGNFSFRNLFEGARGFIVSNETDHLRNAGGYNRLIAELLHALNDGTNTSTERKTELVNEYGLKHNGINANTIYDGDYLRWAEATIAWRMPESVASTFGAGSASVSLSVRNVKVFSDYFNDFKHGWIDPGTRGTIANNAFLQNVDYLKTPTPRRFVLSVRAQF